MVETPWGAYPTSCFPDYGHHKEFFTDYLSAATDLETWTGFWKERIDSPETQAEFLDANGGAATILDITRSTT